MDKAFASNKHILFYILSFSLFIILFSNLCSAWTTDTQQYYANRLCKAIPECNGHYNDLIEKYSMYPDWWYVYPYTYRDHVNYYTGWDCPKGNWTCPDFNDQSALKATRDLLKTSYTKQDSKKWKLIGMASHYYMESEEFWHKVLGEDYTHCHKAMEQAFDENFRNNITDFTVCLCGVCETSKKFDKINDELINYVKTKTYPENFSMKDDKWAERIPRIASDWEIAWNNWDTRIRIYPEVFESIPKATNASNSSKNISKSSNKQALNNK